MGPFNFWGIGTVHRLAHECDLLPLLEQLDVSPFTALPVGTWWGMAVLREPRGRWDAGWKSPGQYGEQIFQISFQAICKKP